ncbi:unnamed protein product [Agarophyton chilense]|eukprot:gb/GEZJ01002037.1/.p1 GENE.gb/GEZJ01002037.1/~~gb/GEZJ01002037.1/.p1  ORF type:complete len:687 (-),score=93.75 gb/GEZJ01002037.1/:3528-5588(-)
MGTGTTHSSRKQPPPPRASSPAWDTRRPYLTSAFLSHQIEQPQPSPTDDNHILAVHDALYALLGVRPAFCCVEATGVPPEITYKPPPPGVLPPDVAPLLARLLPLATHHARVRAFIERFRLPRRTSGHVRQSVAVALETLLHEYHELVLRLEQEAIRSTWSLQTLLYYVQPTMRTMQLLATVSTQLRGAHGGAALNIVYNVAHAHVGTPNHSVLFSHLLQNAAMPIFHHIDAWVIHGLLQDPHKEFFIRHDIRYMRATTTKSWEQRFSINRDMLPDFLSEFATTILRAGKYLNVLRECEVSIPPLQLKAEESLTACARDLLAPGTSRSISAFVTRTYQRAASHLMSHLSKTVRLKERLRSLKSFFLCGSSDYIAHFLDIAQAELSKPRPSVSRSRLASLLDICIRAGVNRNDEFADDVTCVLADDHLAAEISHVDNPRTRGRRDVISGYEAFALDYKLEWPLNLVVSETEVLKYQFLFRYLFYLKYVERELENCWNLHMRAKGSLKRVATSLVRSFALRNRMLHFIRNMLYYTVADVIEPNWRQLETAMHKAKTIDEIMVQHGHFLDVCVTQSLLSNEKHLQVLWALGETCTSFATYTDGFETLIRAREDADVVQNRLKERSYPNTLAKFETSFDLHLGKLMDGLSAVSKKRANVHLANLCERLDGGDYYSRFKERSLASFGNMQI